MSEALGSRALTLVAIFAAVGALTVFLVHQQLDDRAGGRALVTAESIAQEPSLRDTLAKAVPGDPGSSLNGLVDRVRRATGATAVVVASTSGAVYGRSAVPGRDAQLPPAFAPASGGTATPRAGRQVSVSGGVVWGWAPVVDRHGVTIGEVVAGFPAPWPGPPVLRSLAVGLGVGLALALAASLLENRRLRRRLLGLRPDEISTRFQEHEKALRVVADGVICFDAEHRVRFMNNQASRLLGVPRWEPEQSIDDLVPDGRLRDALRGRLGDSELLLIVNEQVVLATHNPVFLPLGQRGSVVTLRDRTESESLLRELDNVLGLTEALRAQAHEFSNRLHTLVGLIGLGRYADAVRFVTEVSVSRNGMMELLVARVHNPMLVALLLAKASVAAERRVQLKIDDETNLPVQLLEPGEAVTVLGNLLDNAMDAATTGNRGDAWVRVKLTSADTDLVIEVADSGPGIPDSLKSSVFIDGFTTKDSAIGARRGLGLALVRQLVANRGGTVNIDGKPGAVFTVVLPNSVATEPPRPADAELSQA